MIHSLKPDPLLVVVLGPTASGKTVLAIKLAQEFAGEIVSCDSVAVYRDFDVGTAKPTADERALVPHHLLDIVAPDETFTAGDYSRRARGVIREISERGRLPIVVGGTGLYLCALLQGLFPGPPRSEQLRQRLRERAGERSPAYLYRILRRMDPAAAARIHANDEPKLIRAIEVCMASRERMSKLWREQGRDPLSGFRILRVGLNPPREKLYERINVRAEKMFENGLVEETKLLVARCGNSKRTMALGSLGYRQAGQYLRGELTLEQAIAAVQQGHRNYAKRQMTWFRREPDVMWLEGFGDDPAIAAKAAELIRAS
jgi:tRNA dimethylallyltransferase